MATTHTVNTRPAVEGDMQVLYDLIKLLAVYEHEEHQVEITVEQLRRDGFGPQPKYHCLIGELDGTPVGYALYFYTYSTWQGLSMYLEDVFVRKEARNNGVGLALCRAVAKEAKNQDCARLQFQVLDWNESAIRFYRTVLHAYERVESTGKWLNYIMRRPEITAFAEAS